MSREASSGKSLTTSFGPGVKWCNDLESVEFLVSRQLIMFLFPRFRT